MEASQSIGAVATNSEEVGKDKQELEVIVDLSSSKTKDSGDVALQPLDVVKGGAANFAIPVESDRRTNSNKLSKRKRKNRKRRIKNAVGLDNSVNEGDSIIERTQASEDGKGEETDTDVEGETREERGLDDGFEQYVNLSDIPSITITTVEGKSSTATDIGTNTNPVMKNAKTFTQEDQTHSSGLLLEEPFVNMHEGYPTHSVSTLLQLAKQRVSNGVLQSSKGSFADGKYEFQSNSSSMFTLSEVENEESEPNFIVPPCSPSSIHNIVTVEESEVVLPEPVKQKSATRTVHFDERPPEVMEAPSDFTPQSLSNLSSVEKLQAAVNELHQIRLKSGTSSSPSKETVILVHNVNSTSATSSIGSSSIVSLESAASLLKGSSSCEDFVESSIHLPSWEALSVEEAVITHNHSEICMNSCSVEEVEKFKIYCPDETMQLNADLDSVFMEAVDMLPEEASYINQYHYSRCADGSEQTVVSSQKCQQNEQGAVSLAFGNPEVIFSIETNECDDSFVDTLLTISQDKNTEVLKLDVNGNPIEAPQELSHQEVSLEVISETETDEIETFSRGSSLPACAQESQIDFEESMMSEEHGSNETIVQANEGIPVIHVETSIVDNANVAGGSLEEAPCSGFKSNEQNEMQTLNTPNAPRSRYPTFYETDESELEMTESVNSVVLKSTTTEQIEVGSSEIPNLESSTSRQSEFITLDIDMSKSKEPNHASGDIPIQICLPDNNNLDESDTESERNGPNTYTDTESDFPFLPERTESLTKAIEKKTKSKPSSNVAGKQATDEGVEPEELDKQGCSCAKLCVIT